ncbi:MAG: adenosine deaminase [Erysipelotrichaceae bacterium]|nr:adenosine deaminase [Erysipelotrichaceae bacterium]
MNTAKIDLHLHLDGSLNFMWTYQMAIKEGVITNDTTYEQFYNEFYNWGDDPFKKFDYVCQILQTAENLNEAAYQLVKRLDEIGLIYAEIRFASQQHCLKGLTQKEAVEAVIAGVKRAEEECDIKIGIINCLMHKGDSAKINLKENLETVRVTKELLGKGVVGIDLAGFENNCDFNEYAPVIAKAKEEGIPLTIHAGEMGEGQHVLDALNMKPDRIGHGINSIQKPEYLQAVLESGVALEVCVSSNTYFGHTYATHPIRKLIDAGVKVTVNTDNMTFSQTDLVNEHSLLRQYSLSKEELMQCTLNAIDVAFCDEETKEYLRKKISE